MRSRRGAVRSALARDPYSAALGWVDCDWASGANNLSLEGSAREPAPERLGPAAGSSLYQYVLYFLYSGYSQTFLDAVFDADHDARISSGQRPRQLAAFQRQSRARGGISPLAAGWRAGSPFWLI